MSQSFEVQPIPEAQSPAHAKELLQEFAESRLPAVIIRNAGTSDVHEAVAGMAEYLPPGMNTEPETMEFNFGDVGGALTPPGLHIDHGPLAEGADQMPITYHLNERGIAVASMFRVGPNFPEISESMRRGPNFPLSEIGQMAAPDFRRGLVNAELVDPRGYQARITPGTLTVFKSGLPLWHEFNTTGNGRLSHAYDSTMTIPEKTRKG